MRPSALTSPFLRAFRAIRCHSEHRVARTAVPEPRRHSDNDLHHRVWLWTLEVCVCVYSFHYTSEGGRANPTATLHEGTGYHATAGLPHGSINAKTNMQGGNAACAQSFSKREEANQEACRRRGPGLVDDDSRRR